MLHVRSHQVTSSEGTAERQFTSEHSRGNDAGQASGVVSRVCGVRSPDTEDVEHGALRLKNGTTTQSSDLK